jgi:hypothetical protein
MRGNVFNRGGVRKLQWQPSCSMRKYGQTERQTDVWTNMKRIVAFRNFAKSDYNREKETLSWVTNGNFFQFFLLPFTKLYPLFRFYSISCSCIHGLACILISNDYRSTLWWQSPSIHDKQGCTVL